MIYINEKGVTFSDTSPVLAKDHISFYHFYEQHLSMINEPKLFCQDSTY